MITVYLNLSTAGIDTGPFNLYSNVDGYAAPFQTGVARTTLTSGVTYTNVPDGTTIVRVLSTSVLCTNYIDITLDNQYTLTWNLDNNELSPAPQIKLRITINNVVQLDLSNTSPSPPPANQSGTLYFSPSDLIQIFCENTSFYPQYEYSDLGLIIADNEFFNSPYISDYSDSSYITSPSEQTKLYLYTKPETQLWNGNVWVTLFTSATEPIPPDGGGDGIQQISWT